MTTRVFVPRAPEGLPAELVLDADESHYLTRVRRRAPGDIIEALDGGGAAWHAEVVVADARQATVRLVGAAPLPPAAAPRHLLLGLPEPPAALEAIAAAGALGVHSVTLVPCERASARAPGEDRIARVQRAVLRQSGRRAPVPVRRAELAAAVEQAPGRRFVASPEAPAGAPPLLSPGEPASVLVGPEGGLTADELALARGAGFEPLWLGPWILETPLAVAAALARLAGPAGQP